MRLFGGDATRRDQIIARTLDLLATTPLERLTTRDIAAAVGVSQPALFRHFTSREAILVAAVASTRASLEPTVAALVASRAPPLEVCAALARALVAHVDRAPGLPRLLFAEAVLDAPELNAAVAALVSMQHTLVTELLRQAAAEGTLAPDVSPAAGATLFVGMMQAVVLGRDAAARELPLADRLAPVLALWLRAVSVHAGESPAVPPVARPPLTARAVRLDVRPVLTSGRDPLADILQVLETLAPTSLLVVTAPIRPVPLERLLAGRGHAVTAHAAPGGAWDLVCIVGGAPAIADFSALEAPEPMEQVLRIAQQLQAGQVALAHLPRTPHWLLPQLEARGIGHEIVTLMDDTAVLRITGPA
jgi:TetR/AcrR family transcriptional regulator